MSKTIEVNAETFQEQVLKADLPVVVDFWSKTCSHCIRFVPEFEAAAESLGDKVIFAKMLSQEAFPLFREYKVMGTPSCLLFKGGQEAARLVGSRSATDLEKWIKTECEL